MFYLQMPSERQNITAGADKIWYEINIQYLGFGLFR